MVSVSSSANASGASATAGSMTAGRVTDILACFIQLANGAAECPLRRALE
jgi:hypothetical protein